MKAGGNAVPGDRVAVPGTEDMVVLKGRPTLSALKRVQRQVYACSCLDAWHATV
jgi:hypothetical protein